MRLRRGIAIGGLVLAGAVSLLSAPALADEAADSTIPVAGPADAPYAADQVLVRYDGSATLTPADVPTGESVDQALERLRQDPTVAAALRDYVAGAAAFTPNDPGHAGTIGGWQQDQWNFADPAAGVGAPTAWSNLNLVERPGGSGVTIAVLDSGVAYKAKGKRFLRNPDLAKSTFVPGHDFVSGDAAPLDESKLGHGTHVAATIAQATDNDLGETGLAYGAKLMPLRVLDRQGNGRASDIAKAIRWAARHGADVINLSLDFPRGIDSCGQIRMVCGAIKRATSLGALVVGAAGNDGAATADWPAAARHVLSVSASTDAGTGCLADYSNAAASASGHWPITAPGGGTCAGAQYGQPIWQYSLRPTAAMNGDFTKFDLVGLTGTSQAAGEASAAAGLVIASGVLGSDPTPAEVAKRLSRCARAAVPAFGAGLLDAGRATAPGSCAS